MKKFGSTFAGIAGSVLLVSTLAACGGGTAASSGDDVTLTYWASNQGTSIDNDKEVLTPVLEEFTAQTGVKVNLEVISWNDLQTRIQTAVTSGQGPDVLNIGNTWAVSLQATGGFTEFGEEEMAAIGGADKFVQTALDTGGAPGTTPTSVPLYGLAYGLYYNKAMFAEAGLEPPTTWEEMQEAATKLTKPEDDVYGMSLAAGSYTENNHFAFINAAQNGSEVFDAEGNPTFTDPGVVDGVLRYLDLMQADKVVNPSDSQYDNGTKSVSAFANKKAAMIINQNNANATITANGMQADEFGVVPFPAPADAPNDTASHVAGINVSIMADSKHQKESLQFVKYLTSPEVQEKLDKPYAALPVLKDAKASFSDNPEEVKIFTDIYQNRSKPLPLVPTEDQFESNVGKAMNNMFATIATGGTVSREDVEREMQAAQDSIR